MTTLKNPTEVKANKPHVCNYCGSKIGKSEKYMHSTHVSDGEIYSWKTHKYCEELATKLKMYEDCDEGVTQEDFIGYVHETHDEIMFSFCETPEERKKYNDLIMQARQADFKSKMWYVIRFLKKVESGEVTTKLKFPVI